MSRLAVVSLCLDFVLLSWGRFSTENPSGGSSCEILPTEPSDYVLQVNVLYPSSSFYGVYEVEKREFLVLDSSTSEDLMNQLSLDQWKLADDEEWRVQRSLDSNSELESISRDVKSLWVLPRGDIREITVFSVLQNEGLVPISYRNVQKLYVKSSVTDRQLKFFVGAPRDLSLHDPDLNPVTGKLNGDVFIVCAPRRRP